MKRFSYLAVLLALIASPVLLQTRAAQQNPQQARESLLNTYCITCHNSRAKTGGLSLDGLDLNAAPNNAEIWEKALRKLRFPAQWDPKLGIHVT